MADGQPMVPAVTGRADSDGFDIKFIAHALRVTKRATERRAVKEGWTFDEQPVRGGRRRLYALATLPEDVQRAVKHADAVAAVRAMEASPHYQAGQQDARRRAVAATVDQAAEHRARMAGAAKAAGLTGKAAERMNARLDVLMALSSFARHQGLGMTAAMETFCGAYAAGEVGSASVRAGLGDEVSPSSLRRWRRMLKTQGAAALAGGYGNRAGSGLIDRDEALAEYCVAQLATTPHMGGRHLWRGIQARFGQAGIDLPSLRSTQRWLDKWKREHHQLYTAVSNPDAWKNKYMTAVGDLSGDVTHLNHKWEADSTPGDVMLLDGRHTIIAVIDVWSRRAMMHVSKTSSAEGVCGVVRKALLAWGVPERFKQDNGADYVSERVQRTLAGLGSDVDVSAPFSPWEKAHIERFFGTFSHDLLELLPNYMGHDVAEAQAIRASQSFAERLFKKNQTTEIRMTGAELQDFCDRWVRDIYEKEPRQGLDGMSVFERVASSTTEVRTVDDVRGLDMLMAEAPDGKGLRTVVKKGLRIDGLYYAAPELGALVGEQVRVLYDPADFGRVVVYHQDAFVCVAECPEVLGTDRRALAIETKVRQQRDITAQRKALRALKSKAKARDIAFEILDERERANETLAALPPPTVTHLTPAMSQANAAAKALAEAGQSEAERPLTANDIADVGRLVRGHQQKDESEEERFRRAIRLLAKPEAERAETEQFWLRSYITTPDFKGRLDMFDAFGGEAFGLGAEFDHLRPSGAQQGEL